MYLYASEHQLMDFHAETLLANANATETTQVNEIDTDKTE
jgi:hypothetical protein